MTRALFSNDFPIFLTVQGVGPLHLPSLVRRFSIFRCNADLVILSIKIFRSEPQCRLCYPKPRAAFH